MHASKRPVVLTKLNHIGPGGINCPCCTPMEPRKLKPLARRAERRKLREIMRAEMEAWEKGEVNYG